MQAADVTDVRARAHHPQHLHLRCAHVQVQGSNGRDEPVHRTFREEMPLDETETYYNERRPHSALRQTCPAAAAAGQA